MNFTAYTPDRLQALRQRYQQRQPVLSLGTVRDFCDSMDQVPELATIQNDLKDLQRPWVFKAILAHVPPGGRILEIGAGEPHVAELLTRCGYEVTVVDPYDGSGNGPTEFEAFCARYPRLKIIRQQFGTHLTEIPAASFDCICSISVLEHIPHPALRDVIQMARRSLKPGGVHIHAVDHVFLGRAMEYHLATLWLLCEELGISSLPLHALLSSVNSDPDVYLLSAEAHNRWRGATPYDQFPMRRGLSVQYVVPQPAR